MSEGEFKRRVRGQIEKQKQESKYPESLENNYIHELYIFSFIDEAAREFPKDLPVSEKTTEDDLWKNFHERNAWFKQYFGGESK